MITIFAIRGERELLLDVSPDQVPALLADEAVNLWVDIDAFEEEAVRLVREVFRFHPLAVEDCFESREHPKVELYDGHLYLITHGLAAGSTPEETETTELDVFLGKRFLVTYHERPSRSVAAVQDVVRRGGELLRRSPAAVLHAILDRQTDGIEAVVDGLDEHLAQLEERVIARPSEKDLGLLMALRRSTLQLRRWMSRQREVMLRLSRNEFAVVAPADAALFRDIHDHLQRFTDLLESYRELATSVQEAYLSMVNNRLNEVMKFLTVFTSILMPLTLVSGIYGMNFEHMPELRVWWGYPAVLGLMAIIALGMLWFFRRRGWLGRPPRYTREERR